MNQVEMGPFAARVQQLLYELVRKHESCDQGCLARHGVTASQGYTLLAVPGASSVSMNELSEAMGLANSTMTRIVDQLVHKGLVSRKHDDEDRRVVRIWLTVKGQQTRRALDKERQDLMQRVLGEIPADERATILYALEKLGELIGKALETCRND